MEAGRGMVMIGINDGLVEETTRVQCIIGGDVGAVSITQSTMFNRFLSVLVISSLIRASVSPHLISLF
jgi:hypothetical protein